jgi:lipopolysaccharide/colanic/teichoic acid biosynthesis glycosyltransferase
MLRFLDIVFSATAILILFPLLLPVMLLLKLTGEHYVFYCQPRVGRGGKDFPVLKFATMLKDSPNMPGGVLTQKNDPRILPMGKFLRKTKINEIPQLLNIFLGQMSFVGPRPQARQHYDLYPTSVKTRIDTLRPGLTGLGSIVFRDEEALLDEIDGDRARFHDQIIVPYKGKLEVWYADHATIRNYLMLILLTFFAVINPQAKLYKRAFHSLPEIPEELSGRI